jgi:hypothetical protein
MLRRVLDLAREERESLDDLLAGINKSLRRSKQFGELFWGHQKLHRSEKEAATRPTRGEIGWLHARRERNKNVPRVDGTAQENDAVEFVRR